LKKERSENVFLRKLQLEGKNIYDIGANFGAFSLFFARATGQQGKVYAFEPLAENCSSIKENARLNLMTNIEVIQTGVGDKKERLIIAYDPVDTATASFVDEIKNKAKNKGTLRTIEMDVNTLDNLVAKLSLPLPDFVKIDVEGMEAKVLKGMQGIIKKKKPQLFIEIHPVAVTSKDIYEILIQHSYSIFSVEANQHVTGENISRIISGHYFCS
jgi:FkbM family methyltransferase